MPWLALFCIALSCVNVFYLGLDLEILLVTVVSAVLGYRNVFSKWGLVLERAVDRSSAKARSNANERDIVERSRAA